MAKKPYFLNWLKELMERRGLESRAELARRSGIPIGAVDKWFVRGSRPGPGHLKALARFAKVDPWFIYDLIMMESLGPRPASRNGQGFSGDITDGIEAVRFIQMLENLSPTQRQRLLGYAEAKYEKILKEE